MEEYPYAKLTEPLCFYNSRDKKKQKFIPNDVNNVGLYVCGPTVYDKPHIGNARPVVVFDLLFRLLRYAYGKEHVTYVRNITDVDDKINARATKEGISIFDLTQKTIQHFHQDVTALKVIHPSIEPRATEHITQMITMIETLVSKGFAYEAEGHVLFEVNKFDRYGQLSGRSKNEMMAGARVDIAPYKRNPMDFVLWKTSQDNTPGWESPWGRGRPGWHIECSAMSIHYLGHNFDIHAGGIDLIFPHHENEVAQSCCAHGMENFAHLWMHNGHVIVEGKKMSKSLGNFLTIHELLQSYHGEVLRLALLMSHYRQPLDFTFKALDSAKSIWYKWKSLAESVAVYDSRDEMNRAQIKQYAQQEIFSLLANDLNTPQMISWCHEMARKAKEDDNSALMFVYAMKAIGFDFIDNEEVSKNSKNFFDHHEVNSLIEQRNCARMKKDFSLADAIRQELFNKGVVIEDTAEGTQWRYL